MNLSVRSVEDIPVSCNFTRARVDDLLRFLCREYRLDIEATGNIVSVFAAAASPQPRPDPMFFTMRPTRRSSTTCGANG